MTISSQTIETNNIKRKKKNHHQRENQSQDDDLLMVKKTTVQIRMTEERKAIWEKHAAKLDVSMTQFVVDCVETVMQGYDILELINKKLDEKLK